MSARTVLTALLPEHLLLAGMVLLLVLELAGGRKVARAALPLALAFLAAATGAALWLHATGYAAVPFPGQYSVTPAASLARALVLALGLPVLLLAHGEFEGHRFPVLLLSSLYGVCLLLGADSFLTLFLGLELMALPVYVLVLLTFRRPSSAEAALKYLVLGGTASALLLMGVALLYGATGSLGLGTFAAALGSGRPPELAGVLLILIALFLKAAIVPFHAWAPDVYEGASVPVTAYMATVVKAAVLLAAVRLFGTRDVGRPLADLLALLPLLSIVWGNLAAMRQPTFRRMIAYSSIAHAGYLFYAFLGAGPGRAGAVLFYLLAYGVLNLLAFAALPAGGDEATSDRLDGLRGLYTRAPGAALAIAVAMVSLAGLPPLPGFTAKFLIFKNVFAAGYPGYAVAGFLGSFLGIYFYLRVVQLMFMSPAEELGAVPAGDGGGGGARAVAKAPCRCLALAAVLLCLAATLALSVVPGWFVALLGG